MAVEHREGRTTADLVYERLEEEIILGRLKPRERLPESALCRRLGSSRTLLREVFRRLEGAGLVTLQPNCGVMVRDFSPQEVEDVYYLRTALERAAIPLIIARARPDDVRDLRRLAQLFEAACRRQDMAAMILQNLAFHRRLARICGNSFLYECLSISHLQTHQIRYMAWMSPARVQRSIREHRLLIGAVRRGDATALRDVILTHLAAGLGDYRHIFPVGAATRQGPRRTPAGRAGKEAQHGESAVAARSARIGRVRPTAHDARGRARVSHQAD